MPSLRLSILGTRGIPAKHGGFETFAEYLARYLAGRGWQVTVYCQTIGHGPIRTSHWQNIELVHIPVRGNGSLGTAQFDWRSTLHAARWGGLALTLGYNTAMFSLVYRLRGIRNIMNMDGLEWRRAKWSIPMKAWFYINERAGCWLANHLIADHPEMETYLATRVRAEKISMLSYGAEQIDSGSEAILDRFDLAPYRYALLIARAEPENSIREIVRAFSARPRGQPLVVLGDYDCERNTYHRQVVDSAGPEVRFIGAVYDRDVVQSLRYFSTLYLHGHQVGGTNPSLVEALGAGTPVLAHDNRFNRWVAGPQAWYFSNEGECTTALDRLLDDNEELDVMRCASRRRHAEEFTWDRVLGEYETLLRQWVDTSKSHPARLGVAGGKRRTN